MFRLTKFDFRRLRHSAIIVEADGPTLKVLRFDDGDYLKLFHRKRLLSSATIYPYSRRFAKNAKSLRRIGVPTVSVHTLFSIPHLKCTAVRYAPLPGMTLREIADSGRKFPAELYGEFLAELHHRGVYFRAAHPGNIVLTPEGTLGLIDVAHCRCLPAPLTPRQRERNLSHIARSQLDADILRQHGEAILSGYKSAAGCRSIAKSPLASPIQA